MHGHTSRNKNSPTLSLVTLAGGVGAEERGLSLAGSASKKSAAWGPMYYDFRRARLTPAEARVSLDEARAALINTWSLVANREVSHETL